VLVVGQSAAGKNVITTEAEDIVGSVIRQRRVKTQQTAVVNCRVCELAIATCICDL
jgi:hypothetical protein